MVAAVDTIERRIGNVMRLNNSGGREGKGRKSAPPRKFVLCEKFAAFLSEVQSLLQTDINGAPGRWTEGDTRALLLDER